MLRGKFLIVASLLLFALPASAQFTIGLKLSPTLSTNRIESSDDSLSLSTDGTGLRLALGPIVDFELKENYFVSTGLLFISKRAGIEATANGSSFREEYKLQYLQIPLTLKLFTNEVALDKRIYFQLGGTLDFNINEEPDKDNYFLVEDFLFFDSSLLLGMGLEYKVGVNTILFGGFTYQRGLVNVINDAAPEAGDFNLKNDSFSLDIGIKF